MFQKQQKITDLFGKPKTSEESTATKSLPSSEKKNQKLLKVHLKISLTLKAPTIWTYFKHATTISVRIVLRPSSLLRHGRRLISLTFRSG